MGTGHVIPTSGWTTVNPGMPLCMALNRSMSMKDMLELLGGWIKMKGELDGQEQVAIYRVPKVECDNVQGPDGSGGSDNRSMQWLNSR